MSDKRTRRRRRILRAVLTVALVSLALPATAGAFVYWANNGGGTIGRANLDGTDVLPNFITGAGFPQGVAVDGEHVYWANLTGGTIGRANLDGSGVDQSFITGASFPVGVTVDAQHVYWDNLDTDSIGRADLDGSDINQSFIATDDGRLRASHGDAAGGHDLHRARLPDRGRRRERPERGGRLQLHRHRNLQPSREVRARRDRRRRIGLPAHLHPVGRRQPDDQ